MKFFRYSSYVLRHKWFVFLECLKYSLVWRGITHDTSKLRPSEFIAYMNYFGGTKNTQRGRDKSGYYNASGAPDAAFRMAWLRHQRRNDHHWEWWIPLGAEPVEMSDAARKEMVSDWRGAGRAQGKGNDVVAFYTANKDRIIIGLETRAWVEREIGFR
jgi:Family of unknown function (DUF5662)